MLPRILTSLLVASARIWQASAIFESEAGVIDWHKPLIGPAHSSTPATFHADANIGPAGIVLSASREGEGGVLGAVNADDGNLIWRYVFDRSDPIKTYSSSGGVVASLSSSILRVFATSDGSLLLETHLPRLPYELPQPETSKIIFIPSSRTGAKRQDIVVLDGGHWISRINGDSGQIEWSSESPTGPETFYTSIAISTDLETLYAAGVGSSFAGYKPGILSLSAQTGKHIKAHTFGIGETQPVLTSHHTVILEANGALKSLELTPNLDSVSRIKTIRTGVKSLENLGNGLFLVELKKDQRVLYQESPEMKTIEQVWEFKHVPGTFYVGSEDKNGGAHLSKLAWVEPLLKVVVDTYSVRDQYVSNFQFAYDQQLHGDVEQATVDPSTSSTEIIRLIVQSSTGSVSSYTSSQPASPLKWTREEGLSAIKDAVFVSLPLPEVIVGSNQYQDGENWLHRLQRQIGASKGLPAYALAFATRFISGKYDVALPVLGDSGNITKLTSDTFGFDQVLVVATSYGRLYGLSTRDGKHLWSRRSGPRSQSARLFVSGETVVLVSQRSNQNEKTVHALGLDGLSGLSAGEEDTSLQEDLLFEGVLKEVYVLGDKEQTLLLIDDTLKTYTYPSDSDSARKVSLHTALPTEPGPRQELKGYRLANHSSTAEATWSLSFVEHETITQVTKNRRGPIASFGRVTNNRGTLYKYLNPHLNVVVTSSATSSKVLVVDVVSGSLIYEVELEGCKNVKATLSDNLLIYTYWDFEHKDGQKIVSVELYEGSDINEKTKSSEISSHSSGMARYQAFEQSYIMPEPITALALTDTKYGMATKDLIIATKQGKIHSVMHRFLDPRRPHRKVTSEETESFLITYDPVIVPQPRRTLSHKYDVSSIHTIITSPTLLESTSLVFGYGLDLFLTRVAPSGTFDVLNADFNKAQLVLTIAALGVGIIFTGPIVKRKILREQWYK